MVCNAFDFRNIVLIEIIEVNEEWKLKLIPYNNNLIVQSSSNKIMTSQQEFELTFNKLDLALESKDKLIYHIERLKTSKTQLKSKRIKLIKVSFQDVSNIEQELNGDDIKQFTREWNSGKKCRTNNVIFGTIIFVLFTDNSSRIFWRSENTIYENYNMTFGSIDLSFLDKYLNKPIDCIDLVHGDKYQYSVRTR
jgi:hypothetical protein